MGEKRNMLFFLGGFRQQLLLFCGPFRLLSLSLHFLFFIVFICSFCSLMRFCVSSVTLLSFSFVHDIFSLPHHSVNLSWKTSVRPSFLLPHFLYYTSIFRSCFRCFLSLWLFSHLLQPMINNNPWMLLYFISFLLIVSFFVLNMFVGVVVENFHKCRQHQEVEEARRREEKRQRRMEKKRRSKARKRASGEGGKGNILCWKKGRKW